jgi:hypothetical protein
LSPKVNKYFSIFELNPFLFFLIDGLQYNDLHGFFSPEFDDVKCTGGFEIWLRVTPHKEYIKLVVFQGKIVGALLIGDTGLEEVFENLILNRLDVGQYGINLLDPSVDIADFFD